MVLKGLSRNFPASRGHFRIKQTVAEDQHFTFWDDLTKAAVAIVFVGNLTETWRIDWQ